jgi:hypothetical protein
VEILKEVVSASSVLLAVVLLVAFGQVLEAVFVDFLSLFILNLSVAAAFLDHHSGVWLGRQRRRRHRLLVSQAASDVII